MSASAHIARAKKRRPKPKRKAATPAQKREISAKQNRACLIKGCGKPIAIFEHWHCVALGNEEAPDSGLCEEHAWLKTYGSPGRVGGDIRDIKHIRKLEEKRTQRDRIEERGYSLIRSRNTLKRDPKFKKQIGTGKVVERG